jgi:7-cyano-7-deazaguanine reductase
MSKIEDIASVHLGKAGDGSVVKPYVTPDSIDGSLLVAIPRKINREAYDIDDENPPFIGFDSWNCYEVSFMLDNGYPVNCVAKIVLPATSKYIVESKSLKLFLNSFNMHKLGSDIDTAILNAQYTIEQHLSKALELKFVPVSLFTDSLYNPSPVPMLGFTPIESLINVELIEFNSFNEDKDILKPMKVSMGLPMQVRTNVLRSNCRVTNQPDWGDVYVHMRGFEVPTHESLLQYIVSMRKENHFHEEICEMIYKRLWSQFDPVELLVGCLYTRRGGIDINPIRASDYPLIDKFCANLESSHTPSPKTMRQ